MTALLAANFLMFALFGAAVFLYLQNYRQKETERRRTRERRAKARNEALAAKQAAMQQRIDHIERTFAKTPFNPFTANPFKAMEDRIEKDLNQVVSVNGSDVPLVK